jgi:hypothetical protein
MIMHELQKRMQTKSEEDLRLSYSREMHEAFLVFDKSFRYSCVIAIYSLLESRLDWLCHRLPKIALNIEDLKGQGLQRYKIYISKAHGLPLPTKDPSWSTIDDLRVVRNFIAHANGRLVNISDEKLQRLRSITDIDTKTAFPLALLVKREFIDRSLQAVEDWYENLVDGCFPQLEQFNPT